MRDNIAMHTGLAVSGILGRPACPSCGQYGLMMVEGCQTCPNCGYSECG